MDVLIEKINKIQDQFRALREDPIELPQIVVVGSQSTGKSSVLESLVRRSFLPRGSGIVTRCPLVLQLLHCPMDDRRRYAKDTTNIEEWGEFLHDDTKIYQIEEIREEIEAQTDRLAGGNKNICHDAITLKIFSPKVPNLTLVDLPGLTKMPVGDQPADIEQRIRKLIHVFIDNPLSIILAVVTANTDMATNDSLQIAKTADPDGSRTLAVVTKLDLMDRGTDAHEILTGKLIPVKLGIIGVVNRSQEDINNNKTIDDSLEAERKFIAEKYPDLASRNGTAYLAETLRRLLMNHIRTCLPDLKRKVQEQISECQEALDRCGDAVTDEKATLTQIISEYNSTFTAMLEAGYLDIKSPVLYGGAEICYIFDNLKTMFEEVDPLERYSLQQVIMAIRNSNGPRPPFLISEHAFEALVKPLIADLRAPSLDCVKAVMKVLNDVGKKSLPQAAVLRFPSVKSEILSEIDSIIEQASKKTNEMVRDVVHIEVKHIAYGHFKCLQDELIQQLSDKGEDEHEEKDKKAKPAYTFGSNSDGSSVGTEGLPFKSDANFVKNLSKHHARDHRQTEPFKFDKKLLEMSEKDKQHVIVLGKMLSLYYTMVSDKVQDSVAKIIMTYLVYNVKNSLQITLVNHLFNDAVMGMLFQEDHQVTSTRSDNKEKLKVLKASLKVLNTVADE